MYFYVHEIYLRATLLKRTVIGSKTILCWGGGGEIIFKKEEEKLYFSLGWF